MPLNNARFVVDHMLLHLDIKVPDTKNEAVSL